MIYILNAYNSPGVSPKASYNLLYSNTRNSFRDRDNHKMLACRHVYQIYHSLSRCGLI